MATSAHLRELELVALSELEPTALEPILAHERARWSTELGWDFRPFESLLLRSFGQHGLDGLAYRRASQVLAYVYTISAPARSHIGGAHRLPGSERAGVDLAVLIEHAITNLREVDRTARIESQFFCLSGDDPSAVFSRHGFRRQPRQFMSIGLAQLCHRLSTNPSVAIRRLRPADRTDIARTIHDGFRGTIDAEISACYRTIGGSRSFVDGVIERDGCGRFDAEASAVSDGDRPEGCILASQIGPDVAHVVQLSVARSAQRRGFGAALLRAAASSFAARGFSTLTLSVSTENHRAYSWYRRLGFATIRQFDAWTWQR